LIPTLFIFIGIPPNKFLSNFRFLSQKFPRLIIRNSNDSANDRRRAQFARYSAPLTSNIYTLCMMV